MITANGLIKLGYTPEVDFTLQDDSDGNGVYIKSWISSDAQPTVSAIEAAEVEWQTAYDSQAYARSRALEYPPAEDYLDGIVKGDTAQVDKYIADCQAVKDKYPKE